MRTRIKNLIIKLMNEEDLYVNLSPRISMKEIEKLKKGIESDE